MVQAIYTAREIVVKDGADTSAPRVQAAGIAQGCPVSLYLFIIVMSVILEAVDKKRNSNTIIKTKPYIVTDDILYADDTMLLATQPENLQQHLDALTEIGKSFGLELNVAKTILLRIRSDSNIAGPGGSPIICKEETVYLGGLVSVDGKPRAELTRRLGEAKGAFEKISAV